MWTATGSLLLSLLAPQDAPRNLRIVAGIDGLDELHVNHRSARWVHREYQVPDSVSINGHDWNPSREPSLATEPDAPFLAGDVDLAGASVRLVRGRGKIDFHHGEDGLVIVFDDRLGGGADAYEVLVEFADELAAAGAILGDAAGDRRYPTELRIEARIDGRDELHLGPHRADWLHLAWAWPTAVKVADRAWRPRAAPLNAPADTGFFAPTIDLSRVQLAVEKARGDVELQHSGGRLFLGFDDGPHHGADDYVVRLTLPEPPRQPARRLPTGPALRVEVAHALDASDVAGSKLAVLALSPATDEYLPWPGLRGMTADGRCVLALPAGTYRFEVLHRPAPNRLVALRSRPRTITRARSLNLPAAEATPLEWHRGEKPVQLVELAIHSMLGVGEIAWTAPAPGAQLEIVASPRAEFSLRAFGRTAEQHLAWWTRRRLGERPRLDSTREVWTRCDFRARGEQQLPADCVGTLHGPRSKLEFPITEDIPLLTNRRLLGFSYRHALADGGTAIYHPRQLVLPESGGRRRFELGGEPAPRGSLAILRNENLGNPDDVELWWELVLVDAAGFVLDVRASDIAWQASPEMKDGTPLPTAPLSASALELLADPIETVALTATYRWNGTREVRVDPAAPVLVGNERYRSSVPGHLDQRAAAYLDKARRVYAAIEAACGRPGSHDVPIELSWWLNGGAVGVWGSITMPIAGMTEDFDWFSFPWALAHESLHAFGYHHGEELDRLDRDAIELFERWAWEAERDPGFVPEGW